MAEKNDNCRVNIRTSPEILGYLDQLVKVGIHGKNRADVAKTLLANEIERLIREGILKIST